MKIGGFLNWTMLKKIAWPCSIAPAVVPTLWGLGLT